MDVYQIRIYKVGIFVGKISSVSRSSPRSPSSIGPVCVFQSRFWPGNEVAPVFPPAVVPQLLHRERERRHFKPLCSFFASLILAQVLICSSWEELQIIAPISVVLETVKLIKPVWPKDSLHTYGAPSLVFSLKALQLHLLLHMAFSVGIKGIWFCKREARLHSEHRNKHCQYIIIEISSTNFALMSNTHIVLCHQHSVILILSPSLTPHLVLSKPHKCKIHW